MKIRLRRILIPVLLCLAVACLVEIPLGQTDLFGEETVLWDTIFRAILAMPGLLYFYREDAPFRGKEVWNIKAAGALFAAGFFLSLLGRLALHFAGGLDYGAAEQVLLSKRVWVSALALLLASPLLEEFFFRGVLYQRLKEIGSPVFAAFLSALLFGLFHGNLSQGIYGFFMGLFLAYSMEKCQTVKAPVLVHLAANLAAFAAAAWNLP